jgi:hypothetical protein
MSLAAVDALVAISRDWGILSPCQAQPMDFVGITRPSHEQDRNNVGKDASSVTDTIGYPDGLDWHGERVCESVVVYGSFQDRFSTSGLELCGSPWMHRKPTRKAALSDFAVL